MISPRKTLQTPERIDRLDARIERIGLVAEPTGDPSEAGGILNPAAIRGPHRELVLYPRCVAEGNISRIGTMRVHESAGGFEIDRLDFALQPEAPYELRPHPGYGCEDPRVTYLEVLKAYVMAYTAFGPDGPRIALAISEDAYRWQRLGLVRFTAGANVVGDDKDAAFFPQPVLSPKGRRSLAFYHRPMLHLSSVDGRASIPMIERMPLKIANRFASRTCRSTRCLRTAPISVTFPKAFKSSAPTRIGAPSRSERVRLPFKFR